LVPAEGRGGVGDETAVDAGHAGVDGLGGAQSAGEVLAEDIGGQSVGRVVGLLDDVVFGVECADAATGPKVSSVRISAAAEMSVRTVAR